VEKTFGTALLGPIGVRHVGIARGMPDDMNTNDPLKTSEGFAFVCVLNFKFPKIFLSASELRVLALPGPNPRRKWKRLNLTGYPYRTGEWQRQRRGSNMWKFNLIQFNSKLNEINLFFFF